LKRKIVIHENGGVRYGKVIGKRPAWNTEEKGILRLAVAERLRTGADTSAGAIFEEIFRAFPDWQRSELAIKTQLPVYIQECFKEQRRQTNQTGTDLTELNRNYHERLDRAVREAKDASEQEAANLRSQMDDLKEDYDAQLLENQRLLIEHADQRTQHDNATIVMNAFVVMMRNPVMFGQMNPQFLSSLVQIANSEVMDQRVDAIPPLPATSYQPPIAISQVNEDVSEMEQH
jgi:hypothetical protein